MPTRPSHLPAPSPPQKGKKLATSLSRILKSPRSRIFYNCRAETLISMGTDATNVARHSDSIVTHEVPRQSLDLTRQTGSVSSYLLVTEDYLYWLSRQVCSNFIPVTYRVLLQNDGLLWKRHSKFGCRKRRGTSGVAEWPRRWVAVNFSRRNLF